MIENWQVDLSRAAKKQYIKLQMSGRKKPSIIDGIDALILDLISNGPVLKKWPNYGLIDKGKKDYFYHCHVKKGKPTYVACWRVVDEKERKIEVFYVGTHEGAPY